MSGNDKDKPQVTTQTNTPYGSGFVDNVFSEAQKLYGAGGSGYQPWTQPVMADLNGYTDKALKLTGSLARQPIAGLNEANSFASNMIANNGMTGDLRQVAGYLTPFADGSMQEDPRLAAMLETNANRAANAAATRFGGGRYGSAAIGQGVGNAVADANNATMLQSNENARSRQLQASGLLGQMYEGGLGRAAQATSMLPMLDNLKYAGAERLAGVGDYFQNRRQAELDAKIQNFQNAPAGQWAGLDRYRSIVQGLGSLGSTQTGIKPNSSASGAQRAIGGAASGLALGAKLGSAVPGIGTGVGAGLGALGGGLLGMWG